jgi:E3 ubiquitin-protein ligase NRDP1
MNHMFECQICLQVLDSPIECQTCTTLFCKSCITKFQTQAGSICPVRCRMPKLQQANKYVRNFLSELEFECNNKVNGCKDTIKYDFLGRHLEACLFASVTCPGCAITDLRSVMTPHIAICELVVVSCEHCKIGVPRGDHKEHRKVCAMLPVPCDYCDQLFTRGSLNEHQ